MNATRHVNDRASVKADQAERVHQVVEEQNRPQRIGARRVISVSSMQDCVSAEGGAQGLSVLKSD
jgi:hypothetical protein